MRKTRRSARVGAAIRNALATVLMGDLKDPALAAAGLISVTGVDVTADLSIAKVFVVGTDNSPEASAALLEGLQRAAPRLRGAVASNVSLRRVPELRFHLDTSIAEGRRIDRILDEIKDDDG